MADYDSSLPIRTEANGDIVSKICDGTTNTQLWTIDTNGIGQINLNDGTTALVINAADNSINVQVGDGTNKLVVNTDGSLNVNLTTAAIVGEIHVYGTLSALAPATPTTCATHTTTAGKTFLLKAVQVAASGKFKAEVKCNAATKAVFFGSTAEGSVEITFPQVIEVGAGLVTLVEVTNRDKANADAYAFINGIEV